MIDLINSLLGTKSEEILQFNKTNYDNSSENNIFANLLENKINETPLSNSNSEMDDLTINIEIESNKDNKDEIKELRDKDKNKLHESISTDENGKKLDLISVIMDIKDNSKVESNKKPKNEAKTFKPDNKNSLNLLSSINHTQIDHNKKNNIEIKVNTLQKNVQEKIKFTLKEMKNGKIDQKRANEIILQTVLNSNNEKLNNIDKNKITLVKMENKREQKRVDPKEQPLKSLKTSEVTNNFDISKPIEKSKNRDLNQEIVANVVKNNDTKDEKVDLKSKKNIERISLENQKDSLKESSIDNKELKSELKFDLNEIKIASSDKKEQSNEVKKTLSDNRERIFDNIVKNTKIIQGNGETRFSTIFRPEELGRVDFKLNIKDGKFDGKLIVQNQESFDFFRNNIEDLRAVFQKSNVELGKLDITLAGAGLNYGEDYSHNGKEQNEGKTDTFSISGNYGKRLEKTFEDNSMNTNLNHYLFNDKRINIFA